MKVFLGGTVDSNWREKVIPKLKCDYFSPLVDNWNESAREEEERQKKICDYHLYVITPQMHGVYSIAEVTDDSNKSPEKTILCILYYWGGISFDRNQRKSLNETAQIILDNGSVVFNDLDSVVKFLNTSYIHKSKEALSYSKLIKKI